MSSALLEAESLGLECVQVFTKNQQQWSAPPLKQEVIGEWAGHLTRLGWRADPARGGATQRVVSHASYLINLASPDAALRAKSIDLMREELARCIALGIGNLVFHPGAFTTSTLADGLPRAAEAVAQVVRETPTATTVMCFENVAGAGTTIGRTFEELAELRKRAIGHGAPADRVGFCIDTCHAHAAGYDLSTPDGARRTFEALDGAVGLSAVRVLHLNDSKGAAGSRLDRHEHIGRGTIGAAGFAAFLACPAFAEIPKIMETPKGNDVASADGVSRPWDSVNVALLRMLIKGNVPADLGAPLTAEQMPVAGARIGRAGTQPRPKKGARAATVLKKQARKK